MTIINKKQFILVGILFSLIVGGYLIFNDISSSKKEIKPVFQETSTVEYQNTRYEFSFSLPEDWKGYSIVTSTWEGYTMGTSGDVPSKRGPLVLIRNPKWTVQVPYQDIPIMIFTLTQWDLMVRDKFHIGAAPINPTILGYNANYVFALPARYNYAFPEGWREVDDILKGNPLKPLLSSSVPSPDGKILICGGIPNGSRENVKETTRLFINLPKDIFPDKENNLRFKTVSGNATAGRISNAGPYGEAFSGNNDCWSYYYEFDGKGEVDLTANPNYHVRFVITTSP